MALLNVHRDFGRDNDVVIAEGAHLSAAVTTKADRGHVHLLCLLDALQDIFRVSRSGNSQENVAGLAQGLYLTREDAVKGKVIAGGRNNRTVSGKCHCA